MKRPIFTTRKLVHMSMLGFAFLLPFLTWAQAAGAALLALLFNLVLLPKLDVDLRKRSEDDASSGVWTGIVVYPVSVLVLILLYRSNMGVVAAVWAIMALGDGMASVVANVLGGAALPWNREKTWTGFLGFLGAGTVGAYALARWMAPTEPAQPVLAISAATAVVGAVVESLPIRLDDNVSVPLVCGAFMFCASTIEASAFWSNWPYFTKRILVAAAVNLALALLALGLKLVNRSGAAAGFVLGVAVYMGYGFKSFSLLLAFFVLGSVATRLGYARKAARGVAERRGGARSWREALANTLAGAFFAVLAITTHLEAAFLLALVAVFAEAAGDTVSSEIGQWLSDRSYLITNFKQVQAGEDGGITLPGTAIGFAASALIVGLGCALGLCGEKGSKGLAGGAIALGAAIAGNLVDSLLGDVVQRRGLVTNAIVNFAGTSFAGGLALGLALHLGL